MGCINNHRGIFMQSGTKLQGGRGLQTCLEKLYPSFVFSQERKYDCIFNIMWAADAQHMSAVYITWEYNSKRPLTQPASLIYGRMTDPGLKSLMAFRSDKLLDVYR